MLPRFRVKTRVAVKSRSPYRTTNSLSDSVSVSESQCGTPDSEVNSLSWHSADFEFLITVLRLRILVSTSLWSRVRLFSVKLKFEVEGTGSNMSPCWQWHDGPPESVTIIGTGSFSELLAELHLHCSHCSFQVQVADLQWLTIKHLLMICHVQVVTASVWWQHDYQVTQKWYFQFQVQAKYILDYSVHNKLLWVNNIYLSMYLGKQNLLSFYIQHNFQLELLAHDLRYCFE